METERTETAQRLEAGALKRALRKEALKRRDMLTDLEREQKSSRIAERLRMHPWYREAAYLLVYASYRSEVSTQEIIRRAIRDGKKVYCPTVTGRREMTFCLLEGALAKDMMQRGFAAMKKSGLGIPEPDADVCAHYAYEPERSLMLMPGCAFDSHGNRIGYGGGFYDRFLAAQPMRTIALFFVCQHSGARIAQESHDVKPDLILTENGWQSAGGQPDCCADTDEISYHEDRKGNGDII